MKKIVVEGGVSLKGEVQISGSKNAVLPIMAATILCPDIYRISRIPDLRDVRTMSSLLEILGARVESKGDTFIIDTRDVNKWEAPYEVVSTMRASVCVLGPLLARFGRAKVSYPGGCVIGTRPIDLHLKGMRMLGAQVSMEDGYVYVKSSHLKGRRIYLGGAFGPTVLGTANVMMAAVKAEGETIIENAACEPEVVDLGNFLVKMGADIKGLGSPTITIRGTCDLRGVDYRVIPDRIEAGTYILAGVITGGEVRVKDVVPAHLSSFLDALSTTGCKIEEGEDWVMAFREGNPLPLQITTLPYPGFPTDLQAQMTVYLTTLPGISIVQERVFPDRFMHVAELLRMGAKIMREGPKAFVMGPTQLIGAPVMASDLRASAALVLAGLKARGKTVINRIYHIDRGYEGIEKKLSLLGAKIRREEE
ncbi:MAG: UDP-N-acetylglucosamine 1-carboxyvinyltransferase [Caldiserica bacterium]|nr:UDP-N-acetylglucosamine 1-carboxyvinyltransferase [Caldisericota bacterium]